MDEHAQSWSDNPNVVFLVALADLNFPYSCEQWGNFGISGIPVIFEDPGIVRDWLNDGVAYPYHAVLDHEMRVVAKPRPYGSTDDTIQQLLDACVPCSEADFDGDGVNDPVDNCPGTFNPDQSDSDGDGLGDLCDDCDTMPGDINDDHTTDILDVVTMVAIIMTGGNNAPGYDDCVLSDADVNLDGSITVLDIIVLISQIIGPRVRVSSLRK